MKAALVFLFCIAVNAPMTAIASWLIFCARGPRPDKEMCQLAAWSDELEPPACVAVGSCEP